MLVIIENITYEDYDFFYEYLYKNVDVFANGDTDKRDVSIADSMVSIRKLQTVKSTACLAKQESQRNKTNLGIMVCYLIKSKCYFKQWKYNILLCTSV